MALKSHAWVIGAIGGIAFTSFCVYAARLGDGPWNPLWVISGCAGAVLLVCWLIIDRASIVAALRSRSFQLSKGAALLTIVAAAIAVLANVVATQHDHRWDITTHKRYAPSEQTIQVIRGLDRDVEVHAFFIGEGLEKTEFKDRFSGYQAESGRLSLTIHDPILSPLMAQQYKVDGTHPTVVFTSGEATQRIESDLGEEALTNALIRVTSDREHIICSTTGHGEIDPDDDENPSSIVSLVVKMEGQNYTFKRVNLLRTDGVPEDCSLLLIPDPQVDWLDAELEYLAAYIGNGGQTVVLLDPGHATGFAAHLKRYGLDVGDDLILESNPDLQLGGADASFLIVGTEQLAVHPITNPTKAMLLFRVARTVRTTVEPVDGITVSELIKTSGSTWGETTLDGKTPPAPDPAVDPVGSLGIAAIAEITAKGALTIRTNTAVGEDNPTPSVLNQKVGGRIIVFGDSDFTSDQLIDQGGNLDLLQNTIAWMVGEANQVSVRTNASARGAFTMDNVQVLIVWLISVLVVPAAAVGGGVATWLSRRKR
ncbi:MAG: GldG family protein [Myxococcota bacterium]